MEIESDRCDSSDLPNLGSQLYAKAAEQNARIEGELHQNLSSVLHTQDRTCRSLIDLSVGNCDVIENGC